MFEIQQITDLTKLSEMHLLLNNAFSSLAAEYKYTKEIVPTFPAFIEFHKIEKQFNDGMNVFYVEQDNKMIGCVGIIASKKIEKQFKLVRLAVDENYRHLGLGSTLVRFAHREMIIRNGNKSVIEIVDHNKILKNWYKTLGYNEVSIDTYENLPFNVCTMEKLF